MSSTVGEIREILDKAYPPSLAESWDKVGLVCGDPEDKVEKVAFALDCTLEVAEQAIDSGADMLVVHHPLLLRGVHSVAADTPKGKVLHLLIRHGVALFAAHTNADSARPGVNDRLAELVGIHPGAPIAPKPGAAKDRWGVHVPAEYASNLKTALFSAGAGEIGDYDCCSFDLEGTGQFRPQEGAHPTLGEVGKLYRDQEIRVEFVAPKAKRAAILSALRYAHPYEEPAFDIVPLADDLDPREAPGLGRIGELPEPMTLKEFCQQVADALPETAWGIRCAGDPEQIVKKVAVSSGAGDSFLDVVRGLGVDVYLTSDLRHHPVDEYLRAGGPAVIDTAHWASEFPWTSQVEEIISREADVTTEIISLRTDPWTLSAHPRKNGHQEGA
ncbi:Nif3-like dinuclear metal center hexameric protein [Corynebacterium sp. 3HC-13]|uniref:Nif3-like dinuclear metal center hexameric protein n=1 Tax=Corynebacterium poyangense TaxID=2684405 RepID=UPI001CCFD88C|nr:Nif3-like dinuclear metal center hexameric protein [Corynebacterium poyangense]MBZ8178457.1 Nif3-like dinuclear metal center hexameric protein [Corynebacterium poyangense]